MKNAHTEAAPPPMRALASIDPDELVDNDEAAKLLGIAPLTLVHWRHHKRGPCFLKVGRSVKYRRADVFAWLAAQRRDPAAAT